MPSVVCTFILGLSAIAASYESENAQFGDFGAYWTAGRCFLEGRDAYDPRQVDRVARSHGVRQAFVTWNPPWTLSIAGIFALLPFKVAAVAWTLINVLLVVAVALAAGRDAGLTPFWSVSLAVTFAPIAACLGFSQWSIVVLAGAVGYRECLRSGRPFWAGVCLAAATLKPHLVALVWIAACVSGSLRRRLIVASGLSAALAIAIAAVGAQQSDAFANYLHALGDPPASWPSNYFSAAPARWLRWGFESALPGRRLDWIAYLPLVLGASAFAWFATRRAVDDQRLFDAALAASALILPYGWHYDQVVLLPAYLALCAFAMRGGLRGLAVGVALASFQAAYILLLAFSGPPSWCFVFPPALVAIWVAVSASPRFRDRDDDGERRLRPKPARRAIKINFN